jgi:hypothetical protein
MIHKSISLIKQLMEKENIFCNSTRCKEARGKSTYCAFQKRRGKPVGVYTSPSLLASFAYAMISSAISEQANLAHRDPLN